jgi:hypothetical protein
MILAFLVLAALLCAVRCDLLIQLTEAGGDVTLTVTGSLDVSGMTPSTTDSSDKTQELHPASGIVNIAQSPGSNDIDIYALDLSTVVFGGGGTSSWTSQTGLFFLDATDVGLPTGYVGGAALLTTTASITGTNFATLGCTPGTYVVSSSIISDIITIQGLLRERELPTTMIFNFCSRSWSERCADVCFCDVDILTNYRRYHAVYRDS